MQIHGLYEDKTCKDYLPKPKAKMLGYVAICTQCFTQYALRANYSHLYWTPVNPVVRVKK